MQMLLEKFEASSAWDSRYNLPLCPGNNNPWIYMAYAVLLMELSGDGSYVGRLMVENHFIKCEAAAPKPAPGLFMRWPDGSGGQNSHDEIMGAAFLSPWIAKRILAYLDANDGEFNVTGEPETPMQFNVYRMPFLRPYLLACAGTTPSPLSQAAWILSLAVDGLLRKKEDCGGALRFWLMTKVMERYPMCRLAIWFWKRRVQKIQTPKSCLTIEPGEHPIFGQCAPETW
jgi:hypothetical protein